MHIVILGAGEIGRHIAEELGKTRHTVIVIERDQAVAEELNDNDNVQVIPGDGSMVSVLLEARADSCDLFIALTSDSITNLATASLVKQINGNATLRTLARTNPLTMEERAMRSTMGIDDASRFNVDYVFSSEHLAATELDKYIRNPSSLRVIEIAGGRIEMQQVTIAGGSKADGTNLINLELPPEVRVATVHRENRHFVPKAWDKLEAGDEVTLFGNQSELKNTLPLFDRRKRGTHRNIVIFGGGEYGVALGSKLISWGDKVTVIDRDAEACARLPGELPGARIEQADATSLPKLKELNVGNADFFVATTQSDEDNVMTCLQAHGLGNVTCLTLIHRADYARVLSGSGTRLGIKAAVSPREATLNDLLRFVTEDSSHLVAELGFGELIETTVTHRNFAEGMMVKEVKWPDDCVVIGRVRHKPSDPAAAAGGKSATGDDEAKPEPKPKPGPGSAGNKLTSKLPSAEDTIRLGDNLFVFIVPAKKRELLRLLRDHP